MFQMDKQLFDRCWPAIAVQIEAGKSAAPLRDSKAPAPSHAAEAGYVLGVASGFGEARANAGPVKDSNCGLSCRRPPTKVFDIESTAYLPSAAFLSPGSDIKASHAGWRIHSTV